MLSQHFSHYFWLFYFTLYFVVVVVLLLFVCALSMSGSCLLHLARSSVICNIIPFRPGGPAWSSVFWRCSLSLVSFSVYVFITFSSLLSFLLLAACWIHCFVILFSWNFSVPFGLSETREKRATDKKQNIKPNEKPEPKQNMNLHIYILCEHRRHRSQRRRWAHSHWWYSVCVERHERHERKKKECERHTWKLRMEEVSSNIPIIFVFLFGVDF